MHKNLSLDIFWYKTDMFRITCFIALFFLVVLLSETKRLIFIWTFNLYFYSFCEKFSVFPISSRGAYLISKLSGAAPIRRRCLREEDAQFKERKIIQIRF